MLFAQAASNMNSDGGATELHPLRQRHDDSFAFSGAKESTTTTESSEMDLNHQLKRHLAPRTIASSPLCL